MRVGVVLVVVRCARRHGGCFFEALEVVVGVRVVEVLVVGVDVVIADDHAAVAAAVAVAPGIIAGWWKLRHARRQRARSC